MFVYFAYPIDNASLTVSMINLINKTRIELIEAGIDVVYDPGDAFRVRRGSTPTGQIAEVNNQAISAADGVVAWLPSGVPSVGVPMEIARAVLMGKPVAVISDVYSWSLRMEAPNLRVFSEGSEGPAVEWIASWERDVVFPDREPLAVLSTGGQIPTRAHDSDAGLDLYVAEDTVLPWGQFVDVPMGINVELPDWSWGLLVGRSSTFRRRQIEVQTGIIDAGYRGPLYAACMWRPDTPTHIADLSTPANTLISKGERLAQLIVLANATRDVEPILVQGLTKSSRGENGFGSSGA